MTANPRMNPDKQQAAQMMFRLAQAGTVEWMDEMIALHERAVAQLKSRRSDFVAACEAQANGKHETTPVTTLSWFVNDVNNCRMNGRLDMAVNHSSALALAAAGIAE
jgi:hypothetical protein